MRPTTTRFWLVLLLLCLPALATRADEGVWVDGSWLEAHLGQERMVVVDMSDSLQYRRFHIPGAVHLEYSRLVQRRKRDKVSVRIDDDRFVRLLGALGIGRDTLVVVYDDTGGLNAARLVWQLDRIGHDKTRVLDGGLVRWILEGRKVTNRATRPRPVSYRFPGETRRNEIDLAGVRRLVEEGGAVILDVRSRDEYAGSPQMPRSGHIPGARWWPWDGTVDFDGGFVHQPLEKIRASLEKAGIGRDDDAVVVYCQSGHRAAHAWLTLRGLGLRNVRLYDGSMAEYARDRRAPLKRGMEP